MSFFEVSHPNDYLLLRYKDIKWFNEFKIIVLLHVALYIAFGYYFN